MLIIKPNDTSMGLLQLLSIVALLCPVYGKISKISVDSDRFFECANGHYVQRVWMCDGEDDCHDNSDETADVCLRKWQCRDDEFTCRDNGLCVPLRLTCDREPDCADKSDEDPQMCHKTSAECPDDQFKCSAKQCIPSHWVCDGYPQCENALDEAHCVRNCTENQFACGDGKCIEKAFFCDGELDCDNGRDEENCPQEKCPHNEFTCDDGSCQPMRFVCDGDVDCADGSDEKNCTAQHKTKICNSNEFECPSRDQCIHQSWVCDGEEDCPDGGDESPEVCSKVCAHGMFQCADKMCVPGVARCDGVADCDDGSDELHCKSGSKCGADEIDCGTVCLDASKACNGVRECANGADESPLCNVNECATENGGCDHICVDDVIGHHCKCRDGYKLGTNSTCVDVDECAEHYGSCSQICTNSIGSFSCSCHQDYAIDPNDVTRCKSNVKNAYVIFARREDIRKIPISDDQIPSIIVNVTSRSTALDFHYEAQEIYWSDEMELTIYKSDVDGLTPKKAVISDNLGKVDGLAVDWVHGNLYWTDTTKKTVEVSNLGGLHRKTLIKGGLEEPRALVLDPEEGWIFWTDWGKNAKIERSGLDGSNRKTIVSNAIRWPNGITLDYDQKRVYWVDAKLASIFSCDYFGLNRRLVVKSDEFLHHPYSVTLFEDFVYWSDWETQMVYRADKFDGRNLGPLSRVARSLQNPMVLQVYHPYRQPRTTNVCSTVSCSHLCLPAPKVCSNLKL